MSYDNIEKKRTALANTLNKLFSRFGKWYVILLYLIFLVIIGFGIRSLIVSDNLVLSLLMIFLPLISILAVWFREWWLVFLPYIISFGTYIRIQNLGYLKGQYPLALDPYLFLRYARMIIEQGSVAALDTMRYVPLGISTFRENIFLSYVIAYLYKFLKLFIPSITLEMSDILYPVIFFGLGLIVFYFLIKELFNDVRIGLLGSFLLTIIPAYLYRTMAGFADKEALASFFMFLALLLYALSLKKHGIGWKIGLGLLAGVFTGFMGLSWGGVKFLLLIMAVFHFVMLIINKLDIKQSIAYLAWLVPTYFMLALFTGKFGGLDGALGSITIQLNLLVLGLLIIKLIVWRLKHKVKDRLKAIKVNWKTLGIVGFGVVIIVLVVLGFVFAEFVNEIVTSLFNPMGTGRLTLTVSENRQPYLISWVNSFSAMLYLFLIGAVYMFYLMVKKLKKYAGFFTAGFALVLIGIVYSRHSTGSLFNGSSSASQVLFFGSFAIFILILIVSAIHMILKNKQVLDEAKKINPNYLLVLSWFIVMMLAARGAIRLFFVLTPVACVVTSFLFVKAYDKARKAKDKIYKIISYVIILLVLGAIVFGFTNTSLDSARRTGPSFSPQWQNAMEWVSEKTPEESVFAHWWDYGYWVQTGGERATILDGMNAIGYWNHLMARHVLSGKSEKEALEFLYAHNASHLLIVSDEIVKYTAYSSIGSNENFDIFSWINVFVMNTRGITREGDLLIYPFGGFSMLDDDFIYENKVFPAEETVIAGFHVPVYDDNVSYEIRQPTAVLYYNKMRTDVPVECVYHQGEKIKYDKPGLKGCLRIMPRFLDMQYQQENGALLYVSEKGEGTLWARLFLFDETDNPYFRPVYDDSGMYHLAYYRGRIIGPLRIWKINYPKGFSIDEETRERYVSRSTPEWLKIKGMSPLRGG